MSSTLISQTMNQGETSSELSIIPLKRRRGRPPKDPSLKRIPKRSKQYLPRPSPNDPTEPKVGQAVTGVVEATLDAGYLLNVRIGNSPMSFRGIVFKSGHYIPVTPENDVAPHLQMIKRNDFFTPGSLAPPKRKYKSRRATVVSVPPVHPAGARGNLVPVVLKPVDFSKGLSGLGLDFGQMVEPLMMLPPDKSIPSGQIILGGQENAARGERVENRVSSEASDSVTENGKEVLISPLTEEVGNEGNGAFSNGVPVTKPFFDCGPGRMTDLLQAVEMKENQVHFGEQLVPGSEAGVRERVMKTETDLNMEGSGP